MQDLGDDEVLERFPVLVGARLERDVERPFQRSFDAGIEVVEFRIRALLFPDGAVIGGQERAHQRVFQDAEIGDDGLGIGSHVSGDVGVVDDRAVRLRRDLQELPEWIEPADDLLGHDLLSQVGQRVGTKVCPFLLRALQRVDLGQACPNAGRRRVRTHPAARTTVSG